MEASNGRIWLTWDTPCYSVQLIRTDAQFIHCESTSVNGKMSCLLTVIYGYNTLEPRRNLWINLQTVAQGIVKPLILCGGFNAILHPQDRLLGNPFTYSEIKDFAECLQDHLSELNWMGGYYT